MFGTVIALLSSSLLVLAAVFAVVRRKTAANTALCIIFLLLASIEIKDQFLINRLFDSFEARKAGLFLESLLPITLSFFGLAYSRLNAAKAFSPRWAALIALSALFPLSVPVFSLNDFFIAPGFREERMLFLGNAGYWFYIGIMGYCIAALVVLEAVFTATSGAARWRIKFELLGMVSIFSVLIFNYSQGLLYRTLNMNLLPLRSGVFIVASLLIGYSKLMRGDGNRVEISRFVIYRSLAFLLVGGYLLALGLVGEGMKYFGGSFGRNLKIFIAFISGIFVLSILFSERLRRIIKVFINKHFYAHKHDYRNEWLKFTGRLASCKTISDVEHTILSTYREAFGLKGASLYLRNKDKMTYSLAANQEMNGDVKEIRISPELEAYFARQHRVFDPFNEEYTPDRDEAAWIRSTGTQQIVPLLANGYVEGLVFFGGQLFREEFIYEDYDLMKTIARQATLSVVNLRLSEELVETREIAVVARISSFVIHDLKNLASTLSLIVENAEAYIGEPDFQRDLLDTMQSTVAGVNGLIQKLKGVPERNVLHTEAADILFLVRDTLVEMKRVRWDLDIRCHGVSAISKIDKEEMRKVAMNLLLNALDAVAGKGEVTVETGISGEQCYFRIQDSGCGMTEEFVRKDLFRPFRTTKKSGLGIGLYQCKQIVEAHGGRIEVRSDFGKGTVFTVYLPRAVESVQESLVHDQL